MISFLKHIKVIAKHQRGATAIEYGLIAALIAVAAVGAMSNLGGQLKKTFNNTQTQMSKG
jgi:pilus assembly protein Flp/PilA